MKHSINSDAKDSERKHQQPDNRIEHQRQKGQRPAEEKQKKPEQEFYHGRSKVIKQSTLLLIRVGGKQVAQRLVADRFYLPETEHGLLLCALRPYSLSPHTPFPSCAISCFAPAPALSPHSHPLAHSPPARRTDNHPSIPSTVPLCRPRTARAPTQAMSSLAIGQDMLLPPATRSNAGWCRTRDLKPRCSLSLVEPGQNPALRRRQR